MGIPVPDNEPADAVHAGRVLFNPREPWHDSDADLVLGVSLVGLPQQVRLQTRMRWDDNMAHLPEAPGWESAPPGWESHWLGNKVVLYNGAKFTGECVRWAVM